MGTKPVTIGVFIIASAIVWAAVIIGCASALSGTEGYDKIQNILLGGMLAHIVLIWGPIAIMIKRMKTERAQ